METKCSNMFELLTSTGLKGFDYTGQTRRLEILRQFGFEGFLTPIYQRLLQNMIEEVYTPRKRLQEILRDQSRFLKLDNLYKLVNSKNISQLNQLNAQISNYNFITPTQQFILNELYAGGYLDDLISKMYLTPLELPKVKAAFNKIMSVLEFPDSDREGSGLNQKLEPVLTNFKALNSIVPGKPLTKKQEKSLLSDIIHSGLINEQIAFESIVAEGYKPGTPLSKDQANKYVQLSCSRDNVEKVESSPSLVHKIPLFPRTMSTSTPLLCLMSPVVVFEE